MEDILTLELPDTLSNTEVKALRDEIKQLSGIEDAGSRVTRSVDLVALGVWFTFASGVFETASTGIPIIQKIIEMVRGKGIKNAVLTLPDGTKLSVDEISVRDLERIIQTINQQAAGPKSKE
jgi:hypothetical protein